MSTGLASQMFRNCTTSLSSRSLARSAFASHSIPSLPRRRCYSDDASKDASKEDAKADTAEGSKTESEGEKKLKAKEEEVVDLTVRLRT